MENIRYSAIVYRHIKAIVNSGIFGFTLCLLIINILYKLTKDLPDAKIKSFPDPTEIEVYARLFLENQVKEKEGRKYDCSGYTQAVYNFFLIKLPASASEQYTATYRLDRDQLTKGDLVFFNTNGRSVSHVGIYLDSLKFIHSPGKNRYVKIDRLDDNYWAKRFVGGGKPKIKNQNL